jgi:hypothetical protein
MKGVTMTTLKVNTERMRRKVATATTKKMIKVVDTVDETTGTMTTSRMMTKSTGQVAPVKETKRKNKGVMKKKGNEGWK